MLVDEVGRAVRRLDIQHALHQVDLQFHGGVLDARGKALQRLRGEALESRFVYAPRFVDAHCARIPAVSIHTIWLRGHALTTGGARDSGPCSARVYIQI